MKKILVIRMSAIGDIVLATSFLESVKQKYPDSEIHFLIKKEFSDIVKKHPIIEAGIEVDWASMQGVTKKHKYNNSKIE